MKWSDFFTSSVGKKIVMSLTGLFLISFLVIHVCINACIFNDLELFNPDDNGDMFNRAAHFMASSILVRTMEYGLFLGFIIHIRSEEHTSELQSPCNLVCRLLLEKKKKNYCNSKIHNNTIIIT